RSRGGAVVDVFAAGRGAAGSIERGDRHGPGPGRGAALPDRRLRATHPASRAADRRDGASCGRGGRGALRRIANVTLGGSRQDLKGQEDTSPFPYSLIS